MEQNKIITIQNSIINYFKMNADKEFVNILCLKVIIDWTAKHNNFIADDCVLFNKIEHYFEIIPFGVPNQNVNIKNPFFKQ